MQLCIRNARLDEGSSLVDVHVDRGRVTAIQPAVPASVRRAADTDIDAAGALVRAPFVEPHIHLDATLTAGEPRWNSSGTLWEGIAVWA